MSKGNSKVEVAWFMSAGVPTLRVSASDLDGIRVIRIWSRLGRVPAEEKTLPCPRRAVSEVFKDFPIDWFPVTVDIVDCQGEEIGHADETDRHGPFNGDGSDSDGVIERDVKKRPGPVKPPPEPPEPNNPPCE